MVYLIEAQGLAARSSLDPDITTDDFQINENDYPVGVFELWNNYRQIVPGQETMNKHDSYHESVIVSTRFCYKCSVWPEVSSEWQSRTRLIGWPQKHLIDSIIKDGCYAIPKDERRWQYSFSNAEKSLFQDGISKHQKYCFLVLKLLCFQILQAQNHFSPEILRHVFLYTCELVPTEFWQTSPGSCVFYMLNELQRGFTNGELPHYFISRKNILSDLSPDQCSEIKEQFDLLRSQICLFLRQINEDQQLCTRGDVIIEQVMEDSILFRSHKSVKESTILTFIPGMINLAKDKINSFSYQSGLELLNQAFQDRLSVSTCDDIVMYHIFLQGSLSGLSTVTTVWFCTFADKQLSGQLANTLIRETCGDLALTHIGDHLPKDKAGCYGTAEVPEYFTTSIDKFCHDYAAFLVFAGKISDALSVLYHCVDLYKERENGNYDFDNLTMFYIYSGLYSIYSRQQQLEMFKSSVDEMGNIAKRMNNFSALSCLMHIYKELGNGESSMRFQYYAQECFTRKSDDSIMHNCQHWPCKYLLLSK